MYVCIDERGGEKLSLSRFPVPCYSANWFTKDRVFYCGYGNPLKEYWPAFFFFSFFPFNSNSAKARKGHKAEQ